MRIRGIFLLSAAPLVLAAALLAAVPAELSAQQAPPGVNIGATDIGGVVSGPNGPEAGVWVIAETKDTPTRFARIVVTDDQGRYLVPDLPKGKYTIWVRGYGLVDSAKIQSEPGKVVNLTSVPARDVRAAAQYYPAIYWYSMMKIPDASQFGPKGIPVKQFEYISLMKNNGCVGCHQLGTLATRTIPAAFGADSKNAWMQRIQSGQAAPLMVNPIAGKFASVPLKYFGDWTDRVAKGELPFAKPPRPQGVERNLVVTTWDWGNDKNGVVLPDYGLYHLVLPRLLKEEDGTRYYQPSSPYSPDGDHPQRADTGDQHPWDIGFGNVDFRGYRKLISRFPNEGGILGPTSLPTMLACMPIDQRKLASWT